MTLDTGVFSATTCNQPPGAAQRSITTRALWRNSNFLFNWINLNADLALYPENTQSLEFLCWLTINCISKTPFTLWILIVSVTHWNYSLSVCILCENVVTQNLPLRPHCSEGDLPFRLFGRLAGTWSHWCFMFYLFTIVSFYISFYIGILILFLCLLKSPINPTIFVQHVQCYMIYNSIIQLCVLITWVREMLEIDVKIIITCLLRQMIKLILSGLSCLRFLPHCKMF